MLVSVPAETRPGERRVALTPESVALLVGQGHDVCVESGAGQGLLAATTTTAAAGADVRTGDVLGGADLVLHVRPLLPGQVARLRPGAVTVGFVHRSGRAGRHTGPAGGRGHGAGDGARAAHLPRPVDGRADLAGPGGRLPLRAGGGDAAAAVLPAVHDRGRHRAARQGARARARGSRACRRSPPPAGSAPSSRRTTCAPPPPTRCGRWAPRSSSSASTRSRAPAATPGSCRRTARSASSEPLAPYIARSDVLITTAAVPGGRLRCW